MERPRVIEVESFLSQLDLLIEKLDINYLGVVKDLIFLCSVPVYPSQTSGGEGCSCLS